MQKWLAHAKTKLGQSLGNYIAKYGEVAGTSRWEAYKAKHLNKGSLQWFQSRHGETEGLRRYKEKNAKLSVGLDSLRANGFSEPEIQEIRLRHSKGSNTSLSSMQLRHGEVEGEALWLVSRERKRLNSKRSLEYWLREFDGDKERAAKALAEYQRNDLSTYVRLYGLAEGAERYAELVARKTRNWNMADRNHSQGQVELEAEVRARFPGEKIHGVEAGYAIFLRKAEQDFLGQRVIFPDILMKDRKVIIEYNGSYWHGHPSMFPDPSVRHKSIPDMTVQQIRDKDSRKLQILADRGFRCLVVWDFEWQNNKDGVLARLWEELV